ncbi:MAG TPA: primase-helicase family protein [Bradyrhizobium sp.]|jgi:hypothetical protein|nr:primase-helicase family protein [Bradyrhizobium sp.]
MTVDFADQFEELTSQSSSTTLPSSCALEDLVSYAQGRSCIYLPCKSSWPNASVDDRLPRMPVLDANGNPVLNKKGGVTTIPASMWLAQNRSVEALTWDPGEPEFIRGRLAVDGGYVEKSGATTLNFYRPPPAIERGDSTQASRWVEHWRMLYPEDAEHIIAWLACRVQRPGEKINHALVLGGAPKIGKDTLLEAVVRTIGEWNFQNIKLNHLGQRNNGFLKSLIVRLNEARDVGEQGTVDRYRLFDHMKDLLAAPPNTIRVNEKYINEYFILNRSGMVITTNYRDALYLPPDDRRHYVAFSERRGEEFPAAFWNDFWGWYEAGGFAHVAALLNQYDLSNFDPKTEPVKTDAFWYMVNADRSGEFSEIADAIDRLKDKDGKRPDALTITQLIVAAPELEWLRAVKMRRLMRRRLEDNGYAVVVNPNAKASDGMWVIDGRRQAIYARAALDLKQRLTAAEQLQAGEATKP